MKHIIAGALAVSMLTGCASDANRAALAELQRHCAAGDQQACAGVPVQERINQDEANANGLKALAIGVLLPLAVLGAAADARVNTYHPTYMIVPVRR